MTVVLPILVFRIVIENAQINVNNDIKNDEEEEKNQESTKIGNMATTIYF